MKSFLSAFALFLFISASSLANTATDLTFMEGRWSGTYNNLSVVSHYIAGNAKIFVGRTYMKDSAGKNQFIELIRVDASVDGKLVMTPFPMGKRGVPFLATDVTKNSVTFENAQNPFPAKINFTVNGDVITTHAEGTENGKPKVIEYNQKRINEN